jgi:hypothetical protein
MKGLKLGMGTNADNGRLFELRGQALHQSILTPWIKSSSRLIEHVDVGAMEEDSRKGQPLFLSRRLF